MSDNYASVNFLAATCKIQACSRNGTATHWIKWN